MTISVAEGSAIVVGAALCALVVIAVEIWRRLRTLQLERRTRRNGVKKLRDALTWALPNQHCLPATPEDPAFHRLFSALEELARPSGGSVAAFGGGDFGGGEFGGGDCGGGDCGDGASAAYDAPLWSGPGAGGAEFEMGDAVPLSSRDGRLRTSFGISRGSSFLTARARL